MSLQIVFNVKQQPVQCPDVLPQRAEANLLFFFLFFFCQYIITVITIVVFRASVGEKHQTKKKNLYVGIYFLALHGQKSDFTMSA